MNYRDPESPWNPRNPADITPEAFERLVLDWLKESARQSGHEIEAEHLGVIEGLGGEYKIDALVTLTIFGGAQVTFLVECKHKNRPVERDDALILEAKLRDVGAHKGMMFSTSGFQSGAIKYAGGKGIATITVIEGKWLYETRSACGGQLNRRLGPNSTRYAGIRVTPTDKGVACHTIDSENTDALVEWLATISEAAEQQSP